MQTKLLQEHAQMLLDTAQVECVIGYSLSPRGLTRPMFIYRGEDVEQLVWNQHSSHNLAKYLREKIVDLGDTGKVAVVLKPCDTKSLNVLVAEHKIDRLRVHVIGMACSGVVKDNNQERLQDRCVECEMKQPLVYDYLIAAEHTPEVSPGEFDQDSWQTEFEDYSSEQKAEFWLAHFDRCLRCYACRQVCPVCDCPTCLFERDDSLWVGPGSSIQEKRMFHLGRAYHLAGRCTGCNECERVCPVNIPISKINQKLAQVIEGEFGFRAGIEAVPSPLLTVVSGKEYGG